VFTAVCVLVLVIVAVLVKVNVGDNITVEVAVLVLVGVCVTVLQVRPFRIYPGLTDVFCMLFGSVIPTTLAQAFHVVVPRST